MAADAASRQTRLAGTDSTLFVTTPGDDGFCRGSVRKPRILLG